MNQWKTAAGFRLAGTMLLVLVLLSGGVPVEMHAALRELSTDRPDSTESPFTVDAGHWQIEMDLVSHTRNQLDGVRTREWDVAPVNLRYGLSNNVEVGLFVSPYTRVTEESRGGPRFTNKGFGDVTLRTKFNFNGNDGTGSAYGLIMDLKLPTAVSELGNGAVEGTVILPFATGLAGGWELGAMTALDLRHREGGGTRGVWINTATVGHELWRDVAVYLELTSEAGEGSHVATFNFGLVWKLNANTQLDAGANLGISRAADDVQIFTGVSRRF